MGIADFKELQGAGYYYIDKTGLIEEVLRTTGTKVTLITRPRRFGKSLGMSMLARFFDIREDSRELFAGLKIYRNKELCAAWLNQYPTVLISFKDITGLEFSVAYERLQGQMSELFMQYEYLLSCDKISEEDKKIFILIKSGEATIGQSSRALGILTRMLQIYYGKPAILLIDEYDVPVSKANENGYYREMLDMIRSMLSIALKDNTSLKFAVVTGCLRITKESIFAGLNNFTTDTISDRRYDEYFGFTEEEVKKLLQDTGLEERFELVQKWYDGYHFGTFDVYCPWDVMNYLLELQQNPYAKPASYWKNTSDNAIIRSFIDYAGSNITLKLETLLSGGYIIQRIEENLTYDYLHSSEENLWSILYLTGYLTQVRNREISDTLPDGMTALKIPNEEIREIFKTTIINWFYDNARTWNRQTLFDAVWKGDSDSITQEMNKLLRKTISYHDYKEDFYHAFLAGIFTGAGYVVESNREHGEGRSDVIVYDSVNGQVAIFEVKYSKALDKMEDACQNALFQINERRYAEEYEDNYDNILCYGISFFKKRCLIRKK